MVYNNEPKHDNRGEGNKAIQSKGIQRLLQQKDTTVHQRPTHAESSLPCRAPQPQCEQRSPNWEGREDRLASPQCQGWRVPHGGAREGGHLASRLQSRGVSISSQGGGPIGRTRRCRGGQGTPHLSSGRGTLQGRTGRGLNSPTAQGFERLTGECSWLRSSFPMSWNGHGAHRRSGRARGWAESTAPGARGRESDSVAGTFV